MVQATEVLARVERLAHELTDAVPGAGEVSTMAGRLVAGAAQLTTTAVQVLKDKIAERSAGKG